MIKFEVVIPDMGIIDITTILGKWRRLDYVGLPVHAQVCMTCKEKKISESILLFGYMPVTEEYGSVSRYIDNVVEIMAEITKEPVIFTKRVL